MKRTYWLIIALVVTGVVMLAGVARTPGSISHAQTGGLLEYGSSVQGIISADMPLATYSFNGNGGDLVHVDVRSLGNGLDPAVDLIGPDQQPLASSHSNRLAVNSRHASIALFLPQSGMYTLMVGGMNGTTGDFILRLQGRAPVTSTPLVYEQAVQVSIPQNAPPLYFTFDAQDCPTILTVTNLANGQPFTFPFAAKVRNQQGHIVALLRGGDAQEDRVTVAPLSGRYEVEVLSSDPALAGTLSLLVACAEASPECPPAGGQETATAGGEVVVVADSSTCVPCPSCPEDLPEVPACPDMNVRILVGDRFLPEWNAVPGADYYWVHLYGLHDDEQVYISASAAAGDATSLDAYYGSLPEGFNGFRFVVEAMQGDEVICVGDATIEFTEPSTACDNFSAWITERTATDIWFAWTPYPDADFFVISAVDEAGEYNEDYIPSQYGGETGGGIFWTEETEPGTYTFRISAMEGDLDDAEVICRREIPVEIPGPTCPDMNLTATVTDPATHGLTLAWTAVPGTDHYLIHLYGLAEEVVYSGALSVPGDATTYTFDHVPVDYPGFTFVLEAVGAGDEPFCDAEVTVEFEPQLLQEPDTLVEPNCDDFTVWIAEQTPDAVTFDWSDFPGAERYVAWVLTETRDLLPLFPIYASAPWSTGSVEALGPGSYTFGVGPWFSDSGTICGKEVPFVLGGQLPAVEPAIPCTIRTPREDVWVHVGPGRNRNVFTYLTPNQDFTVTGQGTDDQGNAWWEIDKTQIPGHEAVNGLWVAQSDVTATGGCDQVQAAEAPPIIPEDTGPGVWLPCGSCDTCGHPASECVTSPEGDCMWDPATCAAPPPGEEPPPQACYRLGTAIDGFRMGSISILTPTNCNVAMSLPKDSTVDLVEKQESLLMCSAVSSSAPSESTLTLQSRGYLPGTVVTVQYTSPDYPSCYVKRWVGCGASGGGNTTSFTMTGSCTITAYAHCN